MSQETPRELSWNTQAVWAAESGPFPYKAAVVPIVNAATFAYEDLDTWQAVALQQRAGHIYSRNSNPTLEVLERKIAARDGTEAAVGFATGMAAISSTFFALLSPGDRVVIIRDSYGCIHVLIEELLPRVGIDVRLCDTTD